MQRIQLVNVHIYWSAITQLDPIRPGTEIASLQNIDIRHTICSVSRTFECLLSLGDPFFSIVSKLVDIYHRQAHYDFHRQVRYDV
jgi:hypothetical protein